MTHQCVALSNQESWRDLRLLDTCVSSIRWIGHKEALQAPEPLIACGLWASRDPVASQLLKHRSDLGAASLLVARFETTNLRSVLNAPADILVSPGEASLVTWEDGQQYEVPCVTVIETALAEGHWARGPSGTSVLAFRPHTQAGLIVLCTATVASPALGASQSDQRALLIRLLDEVENRSPGLSASTVDAGEPEIAASAADYLILHGEDGALVLLAALVAQGAPLDSSALASVGAALPEERLARLVAAMPSAAPEEMEKALRTAGWSAHLRNVTQRRTEAL